MGEKLTPQYEMEDFLLPDEGVNIFRVDEASVIKERKDRQTGAAKPGFEYKVRLAQEGGGADGATHFESFFTETKKDFSARRMFAFLIKVGIYKEDAEVDSDTFKTDTFAKNWPKLVGKKVGLSIAIEKRKDDPTKSRPVSKKFMTVAEAKDEMKKKGTVAVKNEPAAVPASEGWED